MILTAQEILDFANKLTEIEITGEGNQKRLETCILVLEHLAELAKKGRVFILSKND